MTDFCENMSDNMYLELCAKRYVVLEGACGSKHFLLNEVYDGRELVISGVNHLFISGKGTEIVMIGNEEDFTACLGFEIEGNDADLKELNLDGYKKMINQSVQTYPNFKAVATTLRTVKTATVNDWGAICWADGRIYKSKEYKGLEIMDRVGGGDSFASGLIYGLMTTEDAETAVNYGAAHGALAMTTPGDTTMANKKEVEAVMGGAGARVQR